MKGRLYSFLAVVTILFFAFLAGFALLHPGLPPTHDGEYHVIRFYEFDKTLRDDDWYPRWAPDLNNGFGIPLFNYVYPLPNYFSFILHLFGVSFIDAFKLNMFFATIIGSAFFYLWAREFWGTMGGVVSSVFYTFSPYHFVEIYIRGSVGEVWALAFFPAFLWAFTRFVKNKQKIFLAFSSLFLALIIFSHNILALMFFFFALSYIVFLIAQVTNKKYLILNTLHLILISLGLSSIFWLPAILESNLVKGLEIFDLTAHFPDLYQLLIPSWGSGFSGESLNNQLSFQIGIANLLAVLLSILLVTFKICNFRIFRHSGERSDSRIKNRFWTRRVPDGNPSSQNDGKASAVIFFLVFFFFTFFLMLKASQPIWNNAPLMNYFQFPWRFLSLEIIFSSFLAGSIIYFCKSKILAIFLILLTFSLGIGYTKPAYYHYRDDNYYLTRSNFIDGTNSPGNVFNTIFFKTDLKKQKEKLFFLEGSGKINQEIVKSTRYAFDIKAEKDSEIRVNTAYFPGWVIKLDGKRIKPKIASSGLFSFSIPEGQHLVEIKFTDTPARIIGAFGFILSSFILIALSIRVVFATIRR
ncbi:MAG: 6-pyruvoyl-tetrahydropterin synthase-related protein [Patescibacteria group bacterium]